MSPQNHDLSLLQFSTAAPIVLSERLVLRGHRASDLKNCLAMWSDPIVTRFIGGKPSTEQQTWSRMLQYAGHWALMGFGYWLIEEKSTEAFVGEIGFADFKREITPSMRDVPEIGWALSPKFHGKGLAKEAIEAVLNWSESNLRWPRTVCLINPENVPSIKLAERFGYQQFEETDFNGRATIFFERMRQ